MLRFALRAALGFILFGFVAIAAAWFIVEAGGGGRIHDTIADLAPARAGLVLGTAHWLPGHVTNPYFDFRIAAAAQLLASGKVEYLIVSGNQSHGGRPNGGYDEPAEMRDALIAAGAPAARIYRDYAGFRTLDSVLRAKDVFGQDRVIVVSQRFHLARALFLAGSHGLAFDGLTATDVPLSYDVKTKLREAAARVRAIIDVLLGLGPRFGGARITLGVDPPT